MPVTLICQYALCSKPFPVKPSDKDTARFCSTACKNQARLVPLIIEVCPECGQEFPLKGMQRYSDGPHFCSGTCAAVFTGREKSGRGLVDFWQRVERCGHEEWCIYCCWPWTWGQDGQGYGRIVLPGNKNAKAHRIAYALFHGLVLPDSAVVGHYCHNTICCNPSHLHAGTQYDNIQDSVRDKRHTYGERNAQHKLTEDQIREIFRLREAGWTLEAIAKPMGVKFQAIHKIVKGQRWSYLSKPQQ